MAVRLGLSYAAIQGEGKLEMEGVRPQRYATAAGLTATGEPHTFGASAFTATPTLQLQFLQHPLSFLVVCWRTAALESNFVYSPDATM